MTKKSEDFVLQMPGGVCTPAGYEAAGVVCGMKSADGPSAGKDLAVVRSVVPAKCAAVFTTNVVKAWPVLLCQEHVSDGMAQAVVLNSGSANCMTGEQGKNDAADMADLAGRLMGIIPTDVLVCSTGLIGLGLPMGKIRSGIRKAVGQLNRDGGAEAALAIMTTDTYPKQAAAKLHFGEESAYIGGMAKGAGMICPNMATMLSVITTDVDLPADVLGKCLKKAVAESFNKVSVDDETSTNDTLILLANGESGIRPKGKRLEIFQQGLNLVAGRLARMLVEDGEGATKLIAVKVEGAPTAAQAEIAARAIAGSLLVKTAIHGEDPNWGRILSAAGASGVKFDPVRVDLSVAGVEMIRAGEPVKYSAKKAHEALGLHDIEIVLKLHAGSGEAKILTSDLSEEYVMINADYHT